MTTHEFLKSAEWTERAEEVRFEILAACLPVLLYFVSTILSFAGDYPIKWSAFFSIPDAFFGACILFSFALIHALGRRDARHGSSSPASRSIARWRWAGLAGLIICSILSGIAIIYHPKWSLAAGLCTLYVSSLAYKRVLFCKAYLACTDSLAEQRHGRSSLPK
jgi:hypothetical protein